MRCYCRWICLCGLTLRVQWLRVNLCLRGYQVLQVQQVQLDFPDQRGLKATRCVCVCKKMSFWSRWRGAIQYFQNPNRFIGLLMKSLVNERLSEWLRRIFKWCVLKWTGVVWLLNLYVSGWGIRGSPRTSWKSRRARWSSELKHSYSQTFSIIYTDPTMSILGLIRGCINQDSS